MRRKPRISSYEASSRAKKGWVTRRRRDPSAYGHVAKNKRGQAYWMRHNQEIRLKGFNRKEIEQIRPALVATDRMLKKDVKLGLDRIEKKKTRQRRGTTYAQYRVPSHIELGLNAKDSRTIMFGRPKIEVDPRTLKKRKVTASGILAHEIGHSVFPSVPGAIPRSRYLEYQKAFQYKESSKGKGKENIKEMMNYSPATKNHPLKDRKKTLQSKNAAEDFAESYRSLSGLPAGNSRYWKNTYMDQQRLDFMTKHFIEAQKGN